MIKSNIPFTRLEKAIDEVDGKPFRQADGVFSPGKNPFLVEKPLSSNTARGRHSLTGFTLEEAKKIIFKNLTFNTETVKIQNSLGRVLAGKIISPEDFPSFDRSLYDGFAVNSQKLSNAENIFVEPIRISTGQILPEDMDGVVMIEDVSEKNGKLYLNKKITRYENVIRRGEDIKKGKILFRKGHKLRPQDIALLSGFGVKKIKVYKKLSFGIITSGKEIVPFWKKPGYGQVRDMNSGMLLNLIRNAGGEAEYLGACSDEKKEILRFIRNMKNKKFNIVLFCGATSAGVFDVLWPALSGLTGCKALFRGLKMRPGKPTLAAKYGKLLIIGIPGRPSSGFVVFNLLIRNILNYYFDLDKRINAVLEENFTHRKEIEEYVPVKLKQKSSIFYAKPVSGTHSSFHPYINSEGLMKIPSGLKTVKKGSILEVIL